MTPEELLKPRYKVIADYPDNKLTIGDILMQYVENDTVWRHRWSDGHWADITVHNPSYYPHLFKKLEWWEERKPEEMPEYVKAKDSSGEVSKVIEHFSKPYASKPNHPVCKVEYLINGAREFYYELLPATKEEYDNYINRKH